MVRKIIVPALAGGLVMWIVAGLWHNLITPNLYKDVHATHDGIGMLLVVYWILALIMAYLYSKMYSGEKPVKEGLIFGIIIGFLWVFPHEMAMASTHGTSVLYVYKNTAWHLVEQGIGGIVIALVYVKLKTK